jgi:hypothetical protein
MLKLKIKKSDSTDRIPLPYSKLFVENDLSFIKGEINDNISITDGDTVYLDSMYNTTVQTNNIQIDRVLRQGYGTYNRMYEIKNVTDGVYTAYYIEYGDGKYYYQNKPVDGISDNPFFYINNEIYQTNGTKYIAIPTNYWIDNGKITIDDIEYDVEIESIQPSLFLPNGDNVLINLFEDKDKYYVKKFKVEKPILNNIEIESLTPCDYSRYIMYGDKKLTLSSDSINYSHVIINGTEFISNSASSEIDIVINGEKTTYIILSEPFLSDNGHNLIIQTTQENLLNINDIIEAIHISDETIVLPILSESGGNYVIFDTDRYYVEDDVAQTIDINGKRYEIQDYSTNAYIVLDNKKTNLTISGSYAVRYIVGSGANYTQASYLITHHSGVTINNEKYYVEIDSETNTFIPIFINITEDFKLKVIGKYGSSQYILIPIINDSGMNLYEINEQSRYISNKIYSYSWAYVLRKFNTIFGVKEIVPSTQYSFYTIDPQYRADNVNQPLENTLVISVSPYYVIPLSIGTNVENNIMQEMALETDLSAQEKIKSINRIVDMDKDVYYPVYKTNDNVPPQGLDIIRGIDFNLHFRTRDLESWKIIEDDGISATSANSNWFITDNNVYSGLSLNATDKNDILNTSDLLYFLSYTNDDVFYRKKALSQSFLRLTFYDSPDPKTQTMLHMSTVYVDKAKIYKTYIDNIKTSPYIDTRNGYITTGISVTSEYTDKNNKLILTDENKRLSCKMKINNRYETETSSEGFYLYIFKEFTTNLRERTIYMKVDFNHAGIGKTMQFMWPTYDDGKTEVDNIGDLKKGYPLNKIYSKLFIPIKIIYDDVRQRYCYYIDRKYQEGDNGFIYVNGEQHLIFNLFELKIKDETD